MFYIINADDFGGYDNVNNKIISLLLKQAISQTTIMVNCGPTTKEAIQLASTNGLKDKIGLHVSLTHGHPMSNLIKGTSFSSENWLLNDFLSKKIHYFFINRKLKKAIFNEIEAQMEFYNQCGFSLKHFDSHGNIHFYPAFYKIFIKAGLKHGFKTVRLPYLRKTKNPIINLMKIKISNAYKKAFKTIETGTVTLEDALKINFSTRSFEIMAHPKNNNPVEDKLILECNKAFGIPHSYSDIC